MSITAKSKRWETLHSLWIGWTFTLGFFNWIAFLYIGLRAGQMKWILWGLFYSVPFVLAVFLGMVGSNLVIILTLVQGIASIIHAFKIRKEYLRCLAGQQTQVIAPEAEESDTQRTAAPEKTDQDTIHATRKEPDPSPSRPARPTPSAVPEPPLVAINEDSEQSTLDRFGMIPFPTNYPLPLAYSYRMAEAEFETFRVLKELYRNAEGLTAFLASLALSLASPPTGRTKKSLLQGWRGKGATFGSWFSVLEKTTPRIDEEKGPLYRSMKQLLGTKESPSSFAETMAWLVDRRNDLHHGDLPVGPRAEQLVQEVRRRFEHCVSEGEDLWKHPLRLVLDYDAVRNSDYVIATCLDFSGDHPVGRKVQERYRGIPKKQDLYILQDGEQWVSLYPFISIHYCPHCNARETYFIDAWQGPEEEANLRSFERAHEEVSQEIGQELTLRLGR